MEIERINETTIKFYITYHDIERRGFDKEEIWYNRERGEELFFEMMNEVNDDDSFEMNGPLWVQVHALEKGLEVIITRGQMNDGNVKLEIPVGDDKDDNQVDNNIVDMLDQQFVNNKDHEFVKDHSLSVLIGFADFEDLVSLSHSFTEEVFTTLYHFEGRYYIFVTLDESFTDEEQDNLLSRMLEYGYESDLTVYRIEEYGKTIIKENALKVVSEQFS
ncbi:adaptor protein MecA [Salipaludibacillus sp. LMS25]|jgi:adapter protein MecA 1/2|uniref:adaptor protein MecA n=1 Tax=Salipaludibacillus sp. LMS25 TaxID=2924031 RepID=UPI0020D03538|nr:adaptor protein MecA [Salipaludibacillus sp. LMS25]UTR15351.1 adaptor protein MecA [Salipaludibacillus sp. LMS25]